MSSGVGFGEKPETRLREGDRLFYVPTTTAVRICFIVLNLGGPAEAWTDVDTLAAVPKAGGRCAGAEAPSPNPTRTE